MLSKEELAEPIYSSVINHTVANMGNSAIKYMYLPKEYVRGNSSLKSLHEKAVKVCVMALNLFVDKFYIQTNT